MQGTDWNQTAKFFVRSQDAVQNGDSMLAFSANTGLFSRMCVISTRYARAAYCSMNETGMLHAMDRLFGMPLRTASNGSIVRLKTVAFAPSDVMTCISTNKPDDGPGLLTLLLDVEVIVYYTTTGTFTLFASKELTDAGVEQIQVLETKNTSNRLSIFLDTRGFNSDGTLLSTTPRLERNTALTLSALYAICAGLAGAVLLCFITVFLLRRQYSTHSSQDTPQFQPPPHYTSVPTFTTATLADYTYYPRHPLHHTHTLFTQHNTHDLKHAAVDDFAPLRHT